MIKNALPHPALFRSTELREAGAEGSNPLFPTIHNALKSLSFWCFMRLYTIPIHTANVRAMSALPQFEVVVFGFFSALRGAL